MEHETEIVLTDIKRDKTMKVVAAHGAMEP